MACMSACGREFHFACVRSKNSFEAARRRSRARRRPSKSPTCSIADIQVTCVELNRSLEPSLQHMNVYYSAERYRSRRIDEANISTSVAVDQRAANYLAEAVLSFTAMWSRYRSSRADVTFRRPLPVFELFGARRSTASKLASLWNCSAAHELLLRDRKILLLED
ncbi:uncharacterized protein TNCV_1746971 [Trichonephila clavipes]|nr:uncharacterized protein TNCV_1746971 [Trichonephila clavipes]